MLLVEEPFRRSVVREAQDVGLRARRLARREYVLAYPGSRVPRIGDELCAYQGCDRRICRTLEELDSGIRSAYAGLRYCSEACREKDTRERREGLCRCCMLSYADVAIRLSCSHVLCRECITTPSSSTSNGSLHAPGHTPQPPRGCPLCVNTVLSATTPPPPTLQTPMPVRVTTRLHHYHGRPIPEYRPSSTSPLPSSTSPVSPSGVSPSARTPVSPTPARAHLHDPPLRSTW
jgi:hypothetical protein